MTAAADGPAVRGGANPSARPDGSAVHGGANPPGASDVSIVILNFNGRDLLPACLDAVEAQVAPGSGSEIIVVDNGSTDGSVEYLRDRPRVRLIEAGGNLGFAGGNNLGVDAARNDLVILLNNDAIVAAGWLEGLVRCMRDEPDVAVAAARVVTDGVPARYYEMNGSISPAGSNVMRVFDDPETLFYANGCSLIFRKSALGRPFDPEYFCYGEDTYLSLRARFMGWKVKQVPGSRVRHLGGATARRTGSARLVFYQERNRLLNLVLFFSPGFRFKGAPYVGAAAIARLACYAVSSPSRAWHLLRAHLWLATRRGTIARMRERIRGERIRPEAEVIRFMTGKVASGETLAGRIANAFSIAYCRVAGIPVHEIADRRAPGAIGAREVRREETAP